MFFHRVSIKFTGLFKNIFKFSNETQRVTPAFQDKLLKNYQIGLKLIKDNNYKEALSLYSELIEGTQNLKGSRVFNSLLENQAKCFYYLRDYSEAENNYLNIVEYTKYNIKNENISLEDSDLFQYYMKVLWIFIHSGNEKVLNIKLFYIL